MKNFTKSTTALLLMSAVLCFSQHIADPLVNTSWKGIANIPTPAEVVFDFKNGDLDLSYQGNVIEKMKYSFTDQGSLKLIKVQGNSPCDTADEGLYKYQIKDNILTFMIINDKCMERQSAFDGNGYTKIAPAVEVK